MSLFSANQDNAVFVTRTDSDDPLSSYHMLEFELDDRVWPSVEHYFQALKFENLEYREKIRSAKTPRTARRLGRSRFKRIRSDWRKIRETVMTRALYIKCRTHTTVAERLLATGGDTIVERSLYDYFWGCGRDGRGHNAYGKVLMNIRKKLLDEQKR